MDGAIFESLKASFESGARYSVPIPLHIQWCEWASGRPPS